MTEHSTIKEDVIKSLMSGYEFRQSLTVTGVRLCLHIFCETSDWVRVIDRSNFFSVNTAGFTQQRFKKNKL